MEKAWWQSRYDRCTPDYINCAMNREEYEAFMKELVSAQEAEAIDSRHDKSHRNRDSVEIAQNERANHIDHQQHHNGRECQQASFCTNLIHLP